MLYKEYDGINTFLIGMANELLASSIVRKTPYYKCYEFPEPVIIKIKNPQARIVTIPIRKWNWCLPYAESLWIASGRNDMELIGHYLKTMFNFSDDQKFMRAGYGARLRNQTGVKLDYSENDFLAKKSNIQKVGYTDQLDFVIKALTKSEKTRQAIIDLGDPAKDSFNEKGELKITKDFPCTRSLHFMCNSKGQLDLIVHMRSNDFIWGASAVNIFNYTFIQEYVSQILGIEMGSYYHIVNNFHFYDRHLELVKKLSSIKDVKENFHVYNKKFKSLNEFDVELKKLAVFEEQLRTKSNSSLSTFRDEFFNDWAKIFFLKAGYNPQFNNPLLNTLLYG